MGRVSLRDWLAYESDSSGQFEIWVRPYPAVGTAQWQVTTGGGTRPLWMPRGQELLYIATGGEVMGVAVPSGSSWGSTTPKLLVKGGYITNPLNPIRRFTVAFARSSSSTSHVGQRPPTPERCRCP